MSEFPCLAEVLAQHERSYERDSAMVWCSCEAHKSVIASCEVTSDETYIEHVARRWREACTIATTEQLNALPDFIALRDRVGEIWEKEHHLDDGPWWRTGSDGNEYGPECVRLPALLIWHPEWATS